MSLSLNQNPLFEMLALQDSKREVIFEDLRPLRFQDIYVTHSGLSLQGFRAVDITFFNNISEKRKKSLIRYTRIKRITEKKIKGEPGAAFIHHIWSSGYHHWVCECLLKATYLNPKESLLYLPIEYPSFAFESLQLLGFENIRSIPAKTGVKCSQAVLIPNPTSGHFRKNDLLRIKNKFQELCSVNSPTDKRKIFISRSKATLRKIKNEEALLPVLKKFGYEIYHTEELQFKEQVTLFSQCSVVISIHGAGLTNCLFMPEGSTIFEIYRNMKDDKDVMNLCYYRMTRALGHDYLVQFAKISESYENTPNDRQDLLVDLAAFEKNLLLIEQNKRAND